MEGWTLGNGGKDGTPLSSHNILETKRSGMEEIIIGYWWLMVEMHLQYK